MYNWGARSLSRMACVNKDLVDCATLTLSQCMKYDFTIPWMGGFRHANQQFDIFKEGNSNCDGYKKVSNHQTGNALDIMPVIGDNMEAFYYFARKMYINWQNGVKSGKYKGVLQWGGLFGKTGWDKRHWEVLL